MDVDALLVDIDGVLTFGGRALEGAAEAVERLRGEVSVRFVTNTSRKSSYTLLEELGTHGFNLSREEVFTAPMAAASVLKERGAESVMLLAPEDVQRDFLELEVVHDDPDAVVVGDLGDEFRYNVLNTAFRELMDGAELVAIHKNRFWDDGTGLRLDAGPFVEALEYAASVEADVVGKPSEDFFLSALDDVGVEPSRAAMVGDDVYADVGGAAEAGMKTVLVKRGKYRPEVLEESGVTPDVEVEGLAEVPGLLGI